MYGASLMCVTRRPRASINAPIDAAPRPLPIEETTPPVTKTNLVRLLMAVAPCLGREKFRYRPLETRAFSATGGSSQRDRAEACRVAKRAAPSAAVTAARIILA